MLIGSRLSKRYAARLVFRDVNFQVATGIVAAVIGRNGAGKSTLLKIVAGLAQPTAGNVCWHDEESDTKAPTRWRCGLAAPDAPLYRELTALENLRFWMAARGEHDVPDAQLLSRLEQFELRARAHDLAGDLSSGLRARLQLAVATLHAPPILLLDEPGANLDESGRAILQRVLAEQRARGVTLLATNDAREAALCDAAIEL